MSRYYIGVDDLGEPYDALRYSDWNARKVIRTLNKMDKYFGESVINLDPELVRRGNQMIERHNSIALARRGLQA